MLGWIFKKQGQGAVTPAATTTKRVAASPAAAPVAAAVPSVDWPAQLALAAGDDEALLALAGRVGAPLPVRQAAVEALEGEAALRRAEAEFRRHDRRVHQLAKRRLLAQVAQRQCREQAAALIEAARSLVTQADVPANRAVELDHAWQALDANAIAPEQHATFSTLAAALATQLRQRAEAELLHKRWLNESADMLRRLRAACSSAAAGTQDRDTLAGARAEAQQWRDAPPPEGSPAATAAAQVALERALATAAALDGHLAVLNRLLADAEPSPAATPPLSEAPATAEGPAAQAGSVTDSLHAADLHQAWQALAPLPESELAALLQARHAAWQAARDSARHARQQQRKEQARQRQQAQTGEHQSAMAESVALAEAALDAGQLAEAHQHLKALEQSLPQGAAAEALAVRIAAAQGRLAQLRGWQHWAGGRARDELVLQAEALAAATLATGAGDGAADIEVARLSIRQRTDVITTLRERWKEIDRLGGAGGRALWQRFDAALQAAHAPVAAHAALQRAARETNLASRQQLLAQLESLGPAPGGDGMAAAEPAAAAADAHHLAAGLNRFHVEWRKLGPLEHTVPRAARAALERRMAELVQRAEGPLQAARQVARGEREALVLRARALASAGPMRDLPGEARALQAEWQARAKAVPLARGDEQALWSEFRTAIDAAFAARDAVFSARDAEFEAHAIERQALIARLAPDPAQSPAAQRRTLAEVDQAWQRCGPAPRARAAALDAAYTAARQALQQELDQATQRQWQDACDALDAKLALCLAREQASELAAGTAAAAAVASEAWQAWPALPEPLEVVLRSRAGLAPARTADLAPATDELLLQLESAWSVPTPPRFEAARRERKLLAMKAALEGRRSATAADWPADRVLQALLGKTGLDADQQQRLATLLAARRRSGPSKPA